MNTETDVSFASIAPSTVKSIKQRDLLNTWLRLYTSTGDMPRFDAFRPERMADELPDLVYFSVDQQAGQPIITIESDGTRLSDAYGRRGRGQELGSYLGNRHASLALPIYHQCIARRLPAYSIAQVTDTSGVKVDYERLLLPFADIGSEGKVARLIASLKTISEDGSFVLRNLMRGAETPPAYRLRGIIDREFSQVRPLRSGEVDTIEFA